MTDPIYNGCGTEKTCFGFPGGCVETKSCRAVVSCLVQGDRYEFDMKASNSAYVAVGLSQDVNMVRICINFYILSSLTASSMLQPFANPAIHKVFI